MGKSAGRTFAFSAFVFHTATGELMRGGKRLRIPDQAARLLTLLLENPGSMLTRDQLKAELWPEGEVLDYDHSIHRVVSQLREILRDRSSKSTQFIETLPKRGYRFTAPVREILEPEPASDLSPPASSLATSIEAPGTESGLLRSLPALQLSEPERAPEKTRQPLWRKPRVLGLAAAVLLIAAACLLLAYARHRTSSKPLSLGIVPFEATGDDSAALAESFRLNLADVLSQSPEIETRAVHSFDHIGQDENQILSRAQQLSVDVLLFGKFSVTRDRCELHLELVRSRDGVHLSSFQYSGAREELAAISDRVERDIFERLHPYQRTVTLNLARPATSKAYAAYLRGRSYLLQWTDDALLQAVAAFQEATQEDPSYARAYAGLASAYFVLWQHGSNGSHRFDLEKCSASATKAAALDPTLAEAHAMLGQVALNKDWNFPLAEEQLHRAVDLDPNHAIYHQWLSVLYCLEGKYAQSLEEIDKAHAADPDWAPLYMTEIFLAGSAQQFDRADHAAERLLQMMPDWSLAHEQNALRLWAEGKYLPAIAEWRQAAVLEKNAGRIQLEDRGAQLIRTGGVHAYARLRLQAIATNKGMSHEDQDFVPAEWHAYAGDWDQTLAELEKMVKKRSPASLQIPSNPAYAPLRRDPRYLDLLKQIGVAGA
jgi:DNA-binding winged helix-turn-helix (wHTH) protein/tetratricopeptide (TPR) repeat protein